MQHLTVGVFGDGAFLKRLGKAGTTNDLAIRNQADSQRVYTYVSPNSPENKLQPLLQSAGMIDVPVLVANELTKELAEQIVLLDSCGFDSGFIISSSDSLRSLISGTSLERYEWIADEKELAAKLAGLDAKPLSEKVWIPVDNYFDVKGVGTVILGVVRGGVVRKHDALALQPAGKQAVVKGIQSQDKDLEEAGLGTRVGLNLKGVDVSELRRGHVLCKEAQVSKTIRPAFTKSRFCKEEVKAGTSIFFSASLQVIAGKIENSNDFTISLEQPAAYLPGQRCIIASARNALPRIIGSGTIK